MQQRACFTGSVKLKDTWGTSRDESKVIMSWFVCLPEFNTEHVTFYLQSIFYWHWSESYADLNFSGFDCVYSDFPTGSFYLVSISNFLKNSFYSSWLLRWSIDASSLLLCHFAACKQAQQFTIWVNTVVQLPEGWVKPADSSVQVDIVIASLHCLPVCRTISAIHCTSTGQRVQVL